MTIAVFPNLDKRGAAATVERIGDFFISEGIRAILPDNIHSSKYEHMPEEQLYRVADIIVTIGGDGTIMRYAKRASAEGKPVVGINAGRVGYLANIEQNEYKLLGKLKTGEYIVEKRMMLNIRTVENNRTTGSFLALNDAVLTSGYISRIIDVSASVDGESISYRADGLIISTPTGSTAYSMSAGGPIIDPLTENFCITPICSHSLSAKPIIMSADRVVKLKAFSKKRCDIYLTVDGRRCTQIKPYTDIFVTRSEQYVQLIRLNNRSFYKTLSLKFLDSRSMNSER